MTDGPYFIDFDNKTVLQFSCGLPALHADIWLIKLDDGRRIDVTHCANRMFAVHPAGNENISQDENGCYLYKGQPLPLPS